MPKKIIYDSQLLKDKNKKLTEGKYYWNGQFQDFNGLDVTKLEYFRFCKCDCDKKAK